MSDEERTEGTAPEVPPAAPLPGDAPDADLEAAIAAESAATIDAEQAPAGSGPMTTPPPVAGWDVAPEPPVAAAVAAPEPVAPPTAPPVPPAYPTPPADEAAPPVGIAPPEEPPAVPPTAPASSGSGGAGGVIAIAVVIALIVGAVAGIAGGYLGSQLAGKSSVTSVDAKKVTVVPSQTDEPVIAAAAAAVPSVVNLDVSAGLASGGESGLPSEHPTVPSTGNGSGVAFKEAPNGGTYILTNNHVVENAEQITVRSTAGKSWPGTVVGRDPDNDIAVVKIESQLPVIDIGSSADLQVGQTVVAIGSPFGLEHSVTSGVVSAMGRSLPDFSNDTTAGSYPLVDVIQTDAAINPGNSGGALVDKAGKLVGINTAIYTDTGASGGIGFAVPVDKAVKVADELITTGKVVHPFIGIVGMTVDTALATEKKLTVQEGAYVEEVVKGTGSAEAGIKPGDVVTAVDKSAVRSMDDLILLVRRHSAGDTVELTIVRDGKTQTVKVTVGDRPANLESSSPTTTTPAPKK